MSDESQPQVSPSGFRRLPAADPLAAATEGAMSSGFKKIEEPGSTGRAMWEGLLHGIGNIGYGATRLFAKGAEATGLAPEGSADIVGQAAQKREKEFLSPTTGAHPTATALGETVGEMGATIPLSGARAVASAWERLVAGGLSGAAGGAIGAAPLAPQGKEFAPAVGRGAALGAGLGAGLGAAGAAARPAAMEAPRVPPAGLVRAPETTTWRDAARMLTSGDVRLSPGQSRNVGYKERSLQEWPLLRGLVRGQVGRSLDDFDRSVVSQALSPLGTVVPRSVRAGHNLMEFGTKQLDQAYGRVLPNVSLNQNGVAHWLQNDPQLGQMVAEMAPDDVRRLATIVQNRVLGKFQPGTPMDGQTFKTMERDLSTRASTLRGGQSDELGHALDYVLSGMRDELAKQNPTWAPELQKINHAFSMWARVRAAANRDSAGAARFSPRDLLQTLKGEDPSSGGNSFARGREPMQAFAEAGNEIIEPSLTTRAPETSKSAARYVGDVMGGAIGTVPYAAASLAQRVPRIGQAAGALAPGVGVEAGERVNRGRQQRRPFDIAPPPGPR